MTTSPVPVTLHSPFPFQLLPLKRTLRAQLCLHLLASTFLTTTSWNSALKGSATVTPRGKLSLTCVTGAGALVRQGQHQLSSINFSLISSVCVCVCVCVCVWVCVWVWKRECVGLYGCVFRYVWVRVWGVCGCVCEHRCAMRGIWICEWFANRALMLYHNLCRSYERDPLWL